MAHSDDEKNHAASGSKPGPETRPTWTRWATEQPPRRASVLPSAIGRADTNVSQLEHAIWGGLGNLLPDSSDDDDDDSVRPRSRRARESHDKYRRLHVGNNQYRGKGNVSGNDGRLNISVLDKSNTGYLAKALGMVARKVLPKEDSRTAAGPGLDGGDKTSYPKLNIVIMVIGSRGDVTPFLKIGKVLQEQYGHRVRIATHPAFREFVENDSGLEFFSVGGDPAALMAFMVKNPGLIPTLESVKAGDIGKRRAAMAEIWDGFWRACINAADNEADTANLSMMGNTDPFVADAIIGNPPSYAHLHCAECLGVPLFLMFTFPYTPTQAFPHPLASIKKSNVDAGYTNWISYPLVEMMVWQGLGDLINDFRVKRLGLDPVSTVWAPGACYRLHVPFTYLWSPALVPKPDDWSDEIDIAGFVFLDLASSFKPPKDLTEFLDAGEPPVYIGFGSIVVDDPDKFTHMIFEAVKLAGVRALVSKGWGGLGGDSLNVPENILLLDNTPHDWLFPRVRACIIHGGAGTTAIALKCGRPTSIVPFFGDQHFWGSMLAKAGAGPEPVPYKDLTAEKLAESIKFCLGEEAATAAADIAKNIEREGDGAENACRSFHNHLAFSGPRSMRCSLLTDRVAVWQLKKTSLRLSALAAESLVQKGYVSWRKLRLLRHCEWNDFEGPGEPVTGVAGSLMGSVGSFFSGVGGIPYRVVKKRNERRERKEKRKGKGKENGSTGHVKTVTTNALHAAANHDRTGSIKSADAAEEVAVQVGRGAAKSFSALARAPVDLTVALAQGFHNAPRLYGDDTVRRPRRVTGIRSGLAAAGYEFVFGIYDGFTGLVRLPMRGARARGFRGTVAGVGMGLTGFVLKDISAIVGPFGYLLKGLVKQAERGRQPAAYLRRARVAQGQLDMQRLSAQDREKTTADVVRAWDVMGALWLALEADQEKRGRGWRRRVGAGGRWGHGPAFESVEVAEDVLAALRRGESVESVLGPDAARGTRINSESASRKSGTGKQHDEAHLSVGAAAKKGEDHLLAEVVDEKDKENPFAHGSGEIARNKAENEEAEEVLVNGNASGSGHEKVEVTTD